MQLKVVERGADAPAAKVQAFVLDKAASKREPSARSASATPIGAWSKALRNLSSAAVMVTGKGTNNRHRKTPRH